MLEIAESSLIKDVQVAKLQSFGDDRGRFSEMFRKEWFPQRSWNNIQMNRSTSVGNVLRGLHYHFNQVDYWYVVSGTIRAGLVDIRPDSPTYRAADVVEMGDNNPVGLFIPVGVAHGFYAVTDVTLIYVVDNYYDGTDEYGVAWNDPELAVAWGAEAPILSGRDQQNRPLAEIPLDRVPRRQLAT